MSIKNWLAIALFSFILSSCSFDHSSTVESENEQVEGELVVSFFDVGQGDSTLFQTEEFTMLIDTGRHDSDAIFNHLEEHGVETIDLLILTHPHSDHIGNADLIVQQYEPAEVWMDGNEATSQTFERLIDALLEADAEYVEPRAGEAYDYGSIQLDIIHPAELTGNLNNDSLSLIVTYGEVSFLFTGDAEERSEQTMTELGIDLQVDIYQVGHHGSSTSNSEIFLDAIQPQVAIYSAGENNSYGHPHVEVLERLEQRNIEVFGTEQHGTVTLVTDGEWFELSTER